MSNLLLNKIARLKSALGVTPPNWIRSSLLDLLDIINCRRGLVPPLRMRRFIGQDQDFFINRVLQLERCGFIGTERILDVGCGCGSLPISLIRHSNFKGTYEGFDIVKEFIDWLQQHVTTRYPNFHFQHADLCNSNYNTNGKGSSSKYNFPYDDGAFDIVFLGSVFIHMLPDGLEHYFSEIARVLRVNGKCLITYFLLAQNRQNIVDHPLRKEFKDTGRGCSVIDTRIPEKAVGYDPEYITKLYKKNGLKIFEVKHDVLQDCVIAEKEAMVTFFPIEPEMEKIISQK
jgi:SAM-dependent methyltransferase